MAEPTKWEEIRATVRPSTWGELLRLLNAELLGNEEITESMPESLVESGWLGRPGAASAEIEAAERRIGRPLPPSYRAFLTESDGWQHLNGFEVALLPVGQIGWLRELDPELVAIWDEHPQFDSPPDEEYYSYGEEQPWFRTEHIRDMLVVSDQDQCGSDLIWLNPLAIAPDGEWEAWYFVPGDGSATRHRSFRDLMLDELHERIHDRYFPA